MKIRFFIIWPWYKMLKKLCYYRSVLMDQQQKIELFCWAIELKRKTFLSPFCYWQNSSKVVAIVKHMISIIQLERSFVYLLFERESSIRYIIYFFRIPHMQWWMWMIVCNHFNTTFSLNHLTTLMIFQGPVLHSLILFVKKVYFPWMS